MNCVPDIGMPMAMDFLVVPGPLHVLPFEMRVLAIDKNGESSPYEHSLVDKTFHHVAMLRPLSGTNSPTGGLARLRIAMQKVNVAMNVPPVASWSPAPVGLAYVVRGEIVGKPCLLSLLHVKC